MSDYLRHVVTRVLAPHAVLRPRVAAAFEMVQPAGEEVFAAPAAAEVRGGRERVGGRAAGIAEPPDRRVSLHRGDSLPASHVDLSAQPGPQSAAESQDAAPTMVNKLTTTIATAPEAAREIAAPEVVLPAMQPFALDSPAAATVVVHRLPYAPRTPVISRLRREARTENLRTELAAPAPIEITIGRIDVRAIAPAAPPPPQPRTKAPVMSLDDYLATRGRRE